jgi:hypothetical protein
MQTRKFVLPLLACLTLALSLNLSAPKAWAQLVTVDYPGGTETDCNDITNAGLVVGFYLDTTGLGHGFQFANNKFKAINFPGATDTRIYGINSKNGMVGWYIDSSGVTHGFMDSAGTFTTIDPPNTELTNAWTITDSGEVVGTYVDSTTGAYTGFTLVNGTYTPYSAPNSILTEITGLNAQGQEVGIWDDDSGNEHGFVLVGTRFIEIAHDTVTAADRINRESTIVGLYGASTSGPFSGYELANKKYTTVMYPSSTETRVRGINDLGIIVGRYTDSSGVIHGMMGTP